MVTNMFASIVLVLALTGASQAQPPAPQARPPARQPQPPARPPSKPYTPDFEIPKQDAQGGQPRPGSPVAAETYVIGPQDQLQITVTDESDLSGKYRVDTDGSITFP